MQEQEPSVNDILSSIRQILSNKIDEKDVKSTGDVDSVINSPSQSVVEDEKVSEDKLSETEDVFILTQAMQIQNEVKKTPSVSQSGQNISLQAETASSSSAPKISFQGVSMPCSDSQEFAPDDAYIFSEWKQPVGISDGTSQREKVGDVTHVQRNNETVAQKTFEMPQVDVKQMVQAWMDKNLPTMVERIVTEEVRRIFNKH